MKTVNIYEFGGTENLLVEEVEMPEIENDEVLIKVHACGVNRMDVELRAGVYGGEPLLDFYFGKLVKFPHVPGIEPAGEIVEIGSKVAGLQVGDRVGIHSHFSCGVCEQCTSGWDNACPNMKVFGVQTTHQGGYSEYIKIPAKNAIKLKSNVSYIQAATLAVNYGPVWWGLIERAKLTVGETLLITGATGGCGVAAIQIGKLAGATIIATAGSDEKAQKLIEIGADYVINYKNDSVSEKVAEITEGRGADVVIELVGAATWDESVASAGMRGRVIVIGSHGGIRAKLNLGEVFGKHLNIIGVTRANRTTMNKLFDLVAREKIDPVIYKTFSLEEVSEAHDAMEKREHFGKIVLTLND